MTEGIFEFLDKNDNFKIFAISRKKAYAASAKMAAIYASALTSSPLLRKARIELIRFKNTDIPFVNESYKSILAQKVNDRLGFGLTRSV